MKNLNKILIFLTLSLFSLTIPATTCQVTATKISTVCDLTKYAKSRPGSAGYNYFQGYVLGYANKFNLNYQVSSQYCSYSYDEGTLVAAIRANLIANEASCSNTDLDAYLDSQIVANSIVSCL